ncbi:tetratricopeptide repeat protein [Undibacterium flavidum]|uniref:tetratricopeptide repeat protein n=1 Tax=Undibacterium flavidum TaxID=2762297 RepID=UPI001E2B4B3B|nr:tetratricopeptide repeat protein [Undibacterium flavidum]
MLLFSLAALSFLILALSFILFGLRQTSDGSPLLSPLPSPLLTDENTQDASTRDAQSLGLILMIGVVIGASLLYALLGNPQAINANESIVSNNLNQKQEPQNAGLPKPAEMSPEKILAMVDGLASKLQKNPDDAAGWRRLARSYETLRRFPEAVQAYQSLLKLRQNDPEILTDYAVTLAMSKNQTLLGEPEELIAQALKIDPTYIQALALYGSAAFERQDYSLAASTWKKILLNTDPASDFARSIQAGIDKAESLNKKPAAP